MHKLLYLSLVLKWSTCQRRITNGSTVDEDVNTNFVVYIVSAKADDNAPGWLCAGSIIHPYLVLTSASCLHTVHKMYVIAGYRKYVKTEDIENNVCTKQMKKRIVHYCLHTEYGKLKANFDEKHTSEERKYKWTIFDIGIARTETPFDFYDNNYVKYCSYLPGFIRVNFHSKYVYPDTNVVVFGWGHTNYYRPTNDRHNYNVQTLRYASTVIIKAKDCINKFKSRYIRSNIFRNYICTEGPGSTDANGKFLTYEKPQISQCFNRRSGNTEDTDQKRCSTDPEKIYNDTHAILENTRRNGICQNDHGSPLVRWIGSHPYVVGVGSAFQVNTKMQCVGPYLFTSVHCTSRFVHCILSKQSTSESRRSSLCNAPDNVKGYKVKEIYINWTDHDPKPKSDKQYDYLYD